MRRRKPKDPNRSADMPHEWIARHLDRLEPFCLYHPIDLPQWRYRRACLTGPGTYEEIDAEWRTIRVGDMWGGPDTTSFFRCSVTIPESHAGPDTYLDIDMDGGETQLFIDGRPWQGLDYYRSLVPLGEHATAGRQLGLSMEAFIINYPYDERRHDERPMHVFRRARLVRRDAAIAAFLADAKFVLDAYLSYWRDDGDQEIEGFLRHHLEQACREIGPCISSLDEARAAAERAACVLRQAVYESGVFARPGRIDICAHSHLDIVYLWPLKETLRKNCRTMTNALSLMREYPMYTFSYSQPYLYEQLKAMYPGVFDEIRQRVDEGRWEAIGAMYIEPDGNLPGPESWVRQILFGKRFLRDEMGTDSVTCWLPDVFGATYTLPQILRKSGIRYFMTAKLNIWNDTNIFPHDTFRWRGPDGSEVIAHFPPTHFAQELEADNLRRHWRDYREKQGVGENLFIYGLGDGGGGPTRENVEVSLRVRSFPGLPQTRITFAETFFAELEAKQDKLPVWDDELYLEAHRGTYTTRADLKRNNRKAELLYRDAEILSALASMCGGPFVQDVLNEGWKLLLLNQFHDTLPGTHVPAAVADVRAEYEAVFDVGQTVLDQSVRHIASLLPSADAALFNTVAWERRAVVAVPVRDAATHVRVADGTTEAIQRYGDRAYVRAALPSFGWTTVRAVAGTAQEAARTAAFDGQVIQTPLYRIELTEAGEFGRIYDKRHDREVLAAPAGLQCFEDDPGRKFSAWDIAYHLEEYSHPVVQTKPWRLVANGPLFAVLNCTWQVLDSTIEQELWLYHDDPLIELRTQAAWRDSRKLLKAAFPLSVRCRTAIYDLPFGHIERPTHRNTSWDQAKYEVCGHKWADMSEGDYGVALLNDCKYGYDARDNVLRLSLIRSPIRPNPQSDIGSHTFSYALLPHAGGWREAQVDRRAYAFNIPPVAVPVASDATGALPDTVSLLSVDSRSVLVEVLKQAEDGDGLVLRTFDSHGTHGKARLAFGVGVADSAETDLLEENPRPIADAEPQALTVRYTPYEIKTHRITLESL